MKYTIEGIVKGCKYNSYKNKAGQPIEQITISLLNEHGQTKNDLIIEYRIDPLLAKAKGMDKDNFINQVRDKNVKLFGYPIFEFGREQIIIQDIEIPK